MPKPSIYLIAGCNGAGKTTFAKEFLPHEVKCLRFYNADELARGLSPLDPAAAAIKAGRLLLREIRESISRKETSRLKALSAGKRISAFFEERAPQATKSNCIIFGWPGPSRRSRASADAFAWEDMTFL